MAQGGKSRPSRQDAQTSRFWLAHLSLQRAFFLMLSFLMSAVKGCVLKKDFPPLLDKPSEAQAKLPAFFSLSQLSTWLQQAEAKSRTCKEHKPTNAGRDEVCRNVQLLQESEIAQAGQRDTAWRRALNSANKLSAAA